MSTELTVEQWTVELDQGLEFRRKFGLEDHWAELEKLFYNTHGSSLIAGPNIIASTGDSLLSELSVPRPFVSAQALQPGLADEVNILQGIDNTLIGASFMAEEVEAALLHAFLWGKGIIKVGYDSEFGWDPQYDFSVGREEKLGFTLTQFDKKGRRIEYGSKIKPGMIWYAACLPHDIILPYGTFRIRSARWICHRVIRHIEDVKADVKYENTKNLRPTMSMKDFVQSYTTVVKPYRIGQALNQGGSEGDQKNVDFVEMWENHDVKTGKIYVIATGHKKFIRNGIDGLQLNGGLPFVELGFTPSTRNFWVTPDAYYLKQDQAELSDIALQSQKQRRASVLKFMYQEGAIDEDQVERILTRQVGPAVRINQTGSVRDAIVPFTAQNKNILLQQDAEYVRRGARERVGMSRNQAGEFEQRGRRTATEVLEVGQASDTRLSRRQILGVARTYTGWVRMSNEIIFQYWNTPRWTEVGGNWVQFRGRELRGDYTYSLAFSSEPPASMGQRKMEALRMYMMLSQDPFIDQQKLRGYLINAFGDLALREIFVTGDPSGANIPLQLPQQAVSKGAGGIAANPGQGQSMSMSGV